MMINDLVDIDMAPIIDKDGEEDEIVCRNPFELSQEDREAMSAKCSAALKAFKDFVAEIDREYNHKLYLAPQKMDQFETFTLYTLEGREDTEVDGVKCDLLCCIDEDMYWENPYKIGLQSPHVILTLDTDKIEDLQEVLDRYVPQLWKGKNEKGDNRS